MACTYVDVVLAILAVYILLKYWYNSKVDRIRSYGLNFIQPSFLLGNSKDALLGKRHGHEVAAELYKSFPEDRYVVFFEMASPIIYLRDLDLIKKVAIESFDHFPNHRVFVDKDIDAVFGRSLFSLKDTEWKEMRAAVSTAFTPSRMKKMTVRLIKAALQMQQYYHEALTEKQQHSEHPAIMDLDGRNLLLTYFVDLTAMAGFGLDINSFVDTNKTFMKQAKSVAVFDFKAVFMMFGFITMPKLMKILKIQFRSEEPFNFFKRIVVDTISHREKNNIKAADFLDLIIDMRKGNVRSKFTQIKTDNNIISDDWDQINDENNNAKKTNWSELDITVQAMSFIVAGLDGGAANTEFVFYELAQNPDVQKRLQEEIDEAIATHGGITYDAVQDMVYLNMVISETMRKYGTSSERICEKDIDLGPVRPGGKSYSIRKGDGVILFGYAIQRDPKYWPDPMKFDPERFSKANRQNIVPYSYFPFGIGPRICVGFRFAEISMKLAVVALVSTFDIVPTEKTPPVLGFCPKYMIPKGLNPHIGVKLRAP